MIHSPDAEPTPLMAVDVAAKFRLLSTARRLLVPELTARGFLDLLIERELYVDALRLLALALPRRLAVWWGCLCVWQSFREKLPQDVVAALEAAVRWVLDPSEQNRRAAEEPGKSGDFETAASCLAMAAHWSGGSMLPPGLPVVPPAEILTGKLIGGAVLLAALQHGTGEYRRLIRQFLAIGHDIARGRLLWTELDLSAPEPSEAQTGGVLAPDQTEGIQVGSSTVLTPASVSIDSPATDTPIPAN
jgi:hypothetical protein